MERCSVLVVFYYGYRLEKTRTKAGYLRYVFSLVCHKEKGTEEMNDYYERIEPILKYYIKRLETDNIAEDERERLEELLQQYFIKILDE